MGTDAVKVKLEEWSNSLLDLSSRNRLLNLNLSSRRPLTLQLDLPESTSIFHALTAEKTRKIVSPPDPEEESGPLHTVLHDETDESSIQVVHDSDAMDDQDDRVIEVLDDEVLTRLTKSKADKVTLRLMRQARSSMQEQGVNVLYAAFGMLK